MGYWGYEVWENDSSADWFSAVFKQTKIDQVIASSLSKEVDDFTRDEIRGAISLFILLGRAYVYNIGTLDEHHQLCIQKAKKLKDHWNEGGWDSDPDIGKSLDFELAVLQRRLDNIGVPREKRPSAPQELKEWWVKWMD